MGKGNLKIMYIFYELIQLFETERDTEGGRKRETKKAPLVGSLLRCLQHPVPGARTRLRPKPGAGNRIQVSFTSGRNSLT